jgi:hypothetical protein
MPAATVAPVIVEAAQDAPGAAEAPVVEVREVAARPVREGVLRALSAAGGPVRLVLVPGPDAPSPARPGYRAAWWLRQWRGAPPVGAFQRAHEGAIVVGPRLVAGAGVARLVSNRAGALHAAPVSSDRGVGPADGSYDPPRAEVVAELPRVPQGQGGAVELYAGPRAVVPALGELPAELAAELGAVAPDLAGAPGRGLGGLAPARARARRLGTQLAPPVSARSGPFRGGVGASWGGLGGPGVSGEFRESFGRVFIFGNRRAARPIAQAERQPTMLAAAHSPTAPVTVSDFDACEGPDLFAPWMLDSNGQAIQFPAEVVGFRVRFWPPGARGPGELLEDDEGALFVPRNATPEEFRTLVGYRVGRYKLAALDASFQFNPRLPLVVVAITQAMADRAGAAFAPAAAPPPAASADVLAHVLALVKESNAHAQAMADRAQALSEAALMQIRESNARARSSRSRRCNATRTNRSATRRRSLRRWSAPCRACWRRRARRG